MALLHLPHARLYEASSEVSAQKVVHVGRMDAPIVSFPVLAALTFAEALVQREVVADAVPPSRRRRAEKRVEALNAVVDVLQTQLFLAGA